MRNFHELAGQGGGEYAERNLLTDILRKKDPHDYRIPDQNLKNEYKPIRDREFTEAYGTGFPEMLDKYKHLGSGAFGSVFAKPGDDTKVLKAQRQLTAAEQEMGETEIDRQITAAQLGVAPNISTVSNYPIGYRPGAESLLEFDKRQEGVTPRLQVTEMERVPILFDQGGIDTVLDKHIQSKGYKTGDSDERRNNKELRQDSRNEKRKYQLSIAKAKLNLADQGIVHEDLGMGGRIGRDDHVSYNPNTNKLNFIDYGRTEKYDHANNLHVHTQNKNLRDEEIDDYTPEAEAEHFLQHKASNILDGMRAVGNEEEAQIYGGLFHEVLDSGDLIAADDLINQGREIINKHTFKDAELKESKGKKTGNIYGQLRNPSAQEFLVDFAD